MFDDKLGKDDKDKRVNSKSQAFISITSHDNKEMVVSLLKDQDAVGVAMCN